MFDKYVEASESPWRHIEADAGKMQDAIEATKALREELGRLGVTERDLAKLDKIQVERSKATMTIVTALALNEIRSFMTAEANRNLHSHARGMVRSVRNGFGLQVSTEKYLPQVQTKIREMGFALAGSSATCAVLFTPTGGK